MSYVMNNFLIHHQRYLAGISDEQNTANKGVFHRNIVITIYRCKCRGDFSFLQFYPVSFFNHEENAVMCS